VAVVVVFVVAVAVAVVVVVVVVDVVVVGVGANADDTRRNRSVIGEPRERANRSICRYNCGEASTSATSNKKKSFIFDLFGVFFFVPFLETNGGSNFNANDSATIASM
jgi:NADH:ubiquinone oxidoreductase subunit 3 (subunit A)